MAYAAGAMVAATAQDWPAVNRYLRDMQEREGAASLISAMVAWMDTALSATPGSVIDPGDMVAPKYVCAEPGCTDPTPPGVVWAGRMLAARMAGDNDAVSALILSMPNDESVAGDYVAWLLSSCVAAVVDPVPVERVEIDIADLRDAPTFQGGGGR